MKGKRIFADPGFWLLIATNAYLVYYYYQTPHIFTTLVWLYWSQSVMMGLFNVLDMLTVRTVKTEPGPPAKGTGLFRYRVMAAAFFTFHYGFFHVIYTVFLATMKPEFPIDWELFKYFLFAFFVGQVITFVQHKIRQRREGSSLAVMFFIPYLRIVPMHLTILFPVFFPVSNLGVFLILKSIVDVAMYYVTKPNSTRKSEEALLASQQMNM